MGTDIENFGKEQGKKIAEAVALQYGKDPAIQHKGFFASFWQGLFVGLGIDLSNLKLEQEIYSRSLHEATAFFLINGDLKFDNKTIEELKLLLSSKIEKPSEIKESSPEELLGNIIKIFAVDSLAEKGIDP